MDDVELAERAAAVREAWTWVGTPYHHNARIRGAGVDCARLLIEVYAGAGLIERFEPDPYPPDWGFHRDEERYVETVLRFARESTGTPGPGDVVAWRYGRTFSHGAIVTAWPEVIHAFAPALVVEPTCVTGSPMSFRAMRSFTLWPRP